MDKIRDYNQAYKVVMLLPLKQGLKRLTKHINNCQVNVVMLLPLKQGLKQTMSRCGRNPASVLLCYFH